MHFRSKRRGIRVALLFFAIICSSHLILAHPLGQLSINHFARLTSHPDDIQIRYVIDFAEVPTFQESQIADADGDGSLSREELNAYLERVAPIYAGNLELTVNGKRLNLQTVNKEITLAPGTSGSNALGLAVLRIVLDLKGQTSISESPSQFRFEDKNQLDRAGWRELMVVPMNGVTIFNSSLFGNGVTDELRTYPENPTASPLNERTGEWSASIGSLPKGANHLRLRDGTEVKAARDHFVELIAAPQLTPRLMLIGLLFALALGGLHAMSPGHGKAMVGAYLVGSRGTARDAAFLGLTVTITHTIGVFALGLITLFASRYIMPDKLYPILSFTSGALVVAIGLSLFIKRSRVLLAIAQEHEHHHGGQHAAGHHHGGHAHVPPPGERSQISWRSLIALGVSGGIMPCPSALVVMLAAISLNRVGYGLVLIIAFSLGLASVLTGCGLAFVYGGKLIDAIPGSGRLMRVIPVFSAAVIAIIGVVICYQALQQTGIDFTAVWAQSAQPTPTAEVIAILIVGLVYGLQHALDADHLAAVSTIVSERKNIASSMLIGGIWGIGHTLSLLLAGMLVLFLRINIQQFEHLLEFCVSLMLIGLGANALYKLARGGRIHLHAHTHGARTHFHPHLHDGKPESDARSHHGLQFSIRPLIIGMVHGLAGSAALMLIVLAKITSPLVGMAYIGLFGLGSIGGMIGMSALLGLPAHLTAERFSRANLAVRLLAGCFSFGLGLFLAYEIGFKQGLLR